MSFDGPPVTDRPVGRAIAVPMNEIQPQEIRWLWKDFIPRGKLVILCGDPGLGKSFITLDVATRVSRGGPWPLAMDDAQPEPPGDTILLSAEDDPSDTIRPRLERMGADLSRVLIVDGVEDAHKRIESFVIGDHAREIGDLFGRLPNPALLVVDPVSAFVGATDSYNNAQVRAMLKPLSDLAADHNVAVLLVTHMRKSEAAKMLHATMGSLAFTAAARVVLMVNRDPADKEMRILVTVKSNIGNDRKGIGYKVENGVVVWTAEIEGQADEVMQDNTPRRAMAVKRDEASRVFAEKLRNTGPRLAEVCVEELKGMGVPPGVCKTLEWKQKYGIASRKRSDGRWEWVVLDPSALKE